jgi:hypothetical protein
MRRVLRLLVAAVLAVSGITAVSIATDAAAVSGSKLIRWDIVSFSPAPTTVLPVGTAIAEDPAIGHTVELSGSGQADLGAGTARGSGTFVHRRPDGSVVAQGFYLITRLVSFRPLRGTLVGTPIRDGIGDKPDARSGILTMELAAYVGGHVVATGRIAVHCALPGAPASAIEGVLLRVNNGPQFTRVAEDGPTLFHLLARF